MENDSFSVLCYIRNGKLDKLGKAPIYLRITVNGLRAELSIKRKLESGKWCSSKGRAKGTNIKSRELNHYIDELEPKLIISFPNPKRLKGRTVEIVSRTYRHKVAMAT